MVDLLVFRGTVLFKFHVHGFENFKSVVDNLGVSLLEVFFTHSQHIKHKVRESAPFDFADVVPEASGWESIVHLV